MLDAGAERGLEELRVGRGDAVPAERVQVGGEQLRRVEPAARRGRPSRRRSRTSASSSVSQSTSSGWPWASSSRQDRRTRVASPAGGGGTTSSTRYCRCRTRTISPGLGTELGGLVEFIEKSAKIMYDALAGKRTKRRTERFDEGRNGDYGSSIPSKPCLGIPAAGEGICRHRPSVTYLSHNAYMQHTAHHRGMQGSSVGALPFG